MSLTPTPRFINKYSELTHISWKSWWNSQNSFKHYRTWAECDHRLEAIIFQKPLTVDCLIARQAKNWILVDPNLTKYFLSLRKTNINRLTDILSGHYSLTLSIRNSLEYKVHVEYYLGCLGFTPSTNLFLARKEMRKNFQREIYRATVADGSDFYFLNRNMRESSTQRENTSMSSILS